MNVELKKSGTDNRILNVSPGRINGTNFYNGANNLSLLYPLADEIIYHMNNRNDLFIPEYEEVFKKFWNGTTGTLGLKANILMNINRNN